MPSDAHDVSRWLIDIRDHIAKANRFTEGMDYDTFKDDELRIYAVTRCLEVISEASRRLPDELKGRHPDIEWRQMAAAGNVYRHEYEDVAARRIWDTLTYDLPLLQEVIEYELGAAHQMPEPDALHEELGLETAHRQWLKDATLSGELDGPTVDELVEDGAPEPDDGPEPGV